ncbi:MAG: hypothetical protein QOF89_5059 [Acidobacteriota bacterium]|jgi:serine/threonine protein kinase|nr:hypothetical protein [Acidobacteriota bacterium]
MPTIVNIDSVHSGLHPGFEHIHTMEIREPALGSGSFGAVYECVSINGASPSSPQVIKILRDNGFDSAGKGFRTIRKLQKKIVENNKQRSAAKQPRLESLPALQALPQFSFLGEMDNRQVLGYAANHLDVGDYIPFDTILEEEDHRDSYSTLSMEDRIVLATELVEGFQALAEMSFIHADVNAPNLLVNIRDCHLAIIDYDSGAVMDDQDDKPSTFGKNDDWLAPEIRDQMRPQAGQVITVKVDLFTDTWSVFVGIHHLLFLFHPLFFLNVLTSNSVKSYLKDNRWPHITTDHPLFEKQQEILYRYYCEDLNDLPEELQKRFAVTINQGFLVPSQRTSYQQWRWTLRAALRGPEIAYFIADYESVVTGMPARLSWSVSGAHRMLIDNGIGKVDPEGSLELFPTETRRYTLTAQARLGEPVSRCVVIRVWPVPVLSSLQVPTCQIQQRVTLRAPRTPPPQIHLPVKLNLGVQIKQPALKSGTREWFRKARARLSKSLPSFPVHRRPRISARIPAIKLWEV